MTSSRFNTLQAAWIVLLSAFVLRLLLAAQFLLVPDEANYWQWSRYLALGYHDHPPMIAWTIWLCTTLFGQNELAVRLPTIVGVTLASVYICLLAGRWLSHGCAFQVALISQLILLFNGSALIATPDGLLLPCWAGGCYHALNALEKGETRQWLLTGMWFGLGMLSKYTMLLFLPSLFFCMLCTVPYRRQLLTPWPWLGLGLGVLFFIPVLVWNAHNEWATFRHVLYQGGIGHKNFFTLSYIGDFFATQAVLISPIAFLLLIRAWVLKSPQPDISPTVHRFLVWMSLCGFIVFTLLAFHVRIYGNWPAPVYITALVLITACFSSCLEDSARMSGLWKTTLTLAAVIILPICIQVVYPVIPLPLQLDRTARETAGWDRLGRHVGQVRQEMADPDNTFIFGLRYQLASELAFYVPGQPRTVSINRWTRPNVYDFWFSDNMVAGMDGVGVFEYEGMEQHLATLFEQVDPVEPVYMTRRSPWFGEQRVMTLYLIRGYGFKGGLRWQPRNEDDIRATSRQTTK